MKALAQALPLLLGAGVLLFFFLPWATARFTRAFRRRPKADEQAFLLRTVSDVVTGIRTSESDLRDLYSKAERKATFLERYHQEILESLKTGVVACNRRGEITSLNQAAAEILRITPASARGKPLDGLLGPGHLFTRTLGALLKGEPIEDRMELEVRRKGEEPRWIELRTSVLFGRSGSPVGASFHLDDVTERRILRRQMALKERLAAMGEISAGIAHEFRNALHALSGLAKLIARRAEDDTRIEPLAREILGETARMERILHELRLFVKPHDLELEPIAPAHFLRSLLVPFTGDSDSGAVRIELAAAPDLPEIRADRTLLAQAVRNLVQNALQAMEGEGVLRVRAGTFPSGGGAPSHLLVSVSDTGPGIPDEIREKVYTPFFTTRPEGTGLGLPLVQKVAAAHGGNLELESKPGRGTTFTLYLPLPRSAAAKGGPLHSSSGRPGLPGAAAATERADA